MSSEDVAMYQPALGPPPGPILTWGGGFVGLVSGLVSAWFANDRPISNLNSTTAIGWPSPGPRIVRGLRVKVYANAMLTTTTIEITIDGVPSGIQVSVATLATGVFTDTTHTIACAADAEVGLRAQNTSAGVGALTLTATAILAGAAPP